MEMKIKKQLGEKDLYGNKVYVNKREDVFSSKREEIDPGLRTP